MLEKFELKDFKINIKMILASLWTTLMFIYVYGDYFGLYIKGVILRMNDGFMGPLGQVSPIALMAIALMMAIPALMISATLILNAKIARILNIFFGLFYTFIVSLSLMGGAELFYIVYSIIEIIITITICIIAFKWPKQIVVNS